TNREDQGRVIERSRLKLLDIDSVVNAVDPLRCLGKSFTNIIRSEVAHGNDRAGREENFIEPDLEIIRRKNIVGMNGDAVGNAKKFADPESCSCRHSGEMRVHMRDSEFA